MVKVASGAHFKGTAYVDMPILKKYIYVKLYTLLILTKNTNKSSNKLKTLKKTKMVYFQLIYRHINKTVCNIQQIIPQIPTVSDGGT